MYSFLTNRSRSRSREMESTGTKPVSRIQSRPLSSTTITPSTPKQIKRPQTQPAPNILYDSSHSTPKPSAARQKLHDLFRIGRKSSSRSRSRSRPSSPQLSLVDIPPLPTSDDTTPRPRRSSSPQVFRQRSPSPTPPRLLRVTNATPSLASTAPSLKLPKFFSCKSCIKQIKSQSFHLLLLLFNSTQYIH
jgi:hypothetical protein